MIREAVKGAAVAAAVCSLLAAGAARADEKAGKTKDGAKVVHCAGINGCKGQGSCAGADNSCKGQNSCKGKGMMDTKSEKECKDKGGKVVMAKM